MTINLNKKLRKGLQKETNNIRKIIGIKDIVIGVLILLADLIYDGLALKYTWQYEPGFGARQWLIVGIGFIYLAFGIWEVGRKKNK